MTMNPNPPAPVLDPPANAPLPPTLLISNVNSLTPAQRLPALTATQNTENDSITQSAQAQDSVSAVANSDGLGFFVNNEGARAAIRIDNSNPGADWAANPPSLLSTSYIFDSGSFASKALADYENGDFYAVTGFWYRSPEDFGVFADGSPLTEPLPDTGSATYRGNWGAYGWDELDPNNNANLIGIVELQVSFNGDNDMMMEGSASIPSNPAIAGIVFQNIIDDDGDGVFTGGSVNCMSQFFCSGIGGSGSWGGRFVGSPVNNDDGWPAGFVGTFGIHKSTLDRIGFFGAIHEDLCAATGTGDAAFCTK